MAPQQIPFCINDRSRTETSRCVLLQKPPIVIVRNETDILTLRLLGSPETQGLCLFPCIVLSQFPQWEKEASKLPLGQLVKGIGLILQWVFTLHQHMTSVNEAKAGIMPRRQLVGAKANGPLQERAKLDPLIADNARIGSPALQVFLAEITDDFLFEKLPQVEDVMGDAQHLADPPGVIHRIEGAASALRL